MYSCLKPSRFRREKAASKRLDTCSCDERPSKCDSRASLAKRGDFPFLAISRITLDENSLHAAANLTCIFVESETGFTLFPRAILDELRLSSYQDSQNCTSSRLSHFGNRGPRFLF